MKKKLIIGTGIFVLLSLFNVWFSAAAHIMLSEKKLINVSRLKLNMCIESLAVNEQHLQLFLCLELAILLFVLVIGFTAKTAYHSEMHKITDSIETPTPAGQKQHGSARWLTEKEKDEVFDGIGVDELINRYEATKGDEKI